MKTLMKQIIYLAIGLLFAPMLEGIITEVYNLRLSETTKRSVFEYDYDDPMLVTGTFIDAFRKKYNGTKHWLQAGMATASYTKPSYYFRADFAEGKVSSKKLGVNFSRVMADDLLLAGGYSTAINNRIKITGTGYLGLPLHQDTSLLYVQFGYGHVGLGIQGDGSFVLTESRKHILRPAIRIVHFLKRKVCAPTDLGLIAAYYTFGNLIDFFLSYQFHTEKIRFELGYDMTILWGSQINPYVADVTKETNYIRHDFYTSYKRRFKIYDVHNALLFAMSAGFDQIPKEFGYTRILVFWTSWEVNF